MTDKLRVLVVDDSKVIRKAFTRILSEDYDMVEAENGEVAWDVLQQDDDICAVFTDINMPHLDGRGLLARIREAEDDEVKSLPVIFVTAADDGEDKTREALAAGATDYVLKPFDSVFLKSKAKAHVKPRDKSISDSAMATLDPLTRLANKTYFQERGIQEMSAANRRKADLALLFISIDRFDDLVKTTDNKVLKGIIRKLGSYLSSEVRVEDTVARIDRGRFAILLNGTDISGAVELAERLLEKVKQRVIRHKEETFNIAISIGISALPPEINRTFDMLQMEADRYLREAISEGGNRIVPTKQAKAEPKEKSAVVTSLDNAMAMLNRRENKLTPEQAAEVIRHLLPLLEYCDRILNLELGDKLVAMKEKYPT